MDEETFAAIRLTLIVAGISVPLNLVCGVAAAKAIAKFQFKGKAFLTTLIDLPFSVSPVISGLVFVLSVQLKKCFRWWPWLQNHSSEILFALPGIILATMFVTFPLRCPRIDPADAGAGEGGRSGSIVARRQWLADLSGM